MGAERGPDGMALADGLLLTIATASRFLGVPPRRIYSWIAAGHIPAAAVKHMGRAVYLVRPVLEGWLRSNDAAKPGDET